MAQPIAIKLSVLRYNPGINKGNYIQHINGLVAATTVKNAVVVDMEDFIDEELCPFYYAYVSLKSKQC